MSKRGFDELDVADELPAKRSREHESALQQVLALARGLTQAEIELLISSLPVRVASNPAEQAWRLLLNDSDVLEKYLSNADLAKLPRLSQTQRKYAPTAHVRPRTEADVSYAKNITIDAKSVGNLAYLRIKFHPTKRLNITVSGLNFKQLQVVFPWLPPNTYNLTFISCHFPAAIDLSKLNSAHFMRFEKCSLLSEFAFQWPPYVVRMEFVMCTVRSPVAKLKLPDSLRQFVMKDFAGAKPVLNANLVYCDMSNETSMQCYYPDDFPPTLEFLRMKTPHEIKDGAPFAFNLPNLAYLEYVVRSSLGQRGELDPSSMPNLKELTTNLKLITGSDSLKRLSFGMMDSWYLRFPNLTDVDINWAHDDADEANALFPPTYRDSPSKILAPKYMPNLQTITYTQHTRDDGIEMDISGWPHLTKVYAPNVIVEGASASLQEIVCMEMAPSTNTPSLRKLHTTLAMTQDENNPGFDLPSLKELKILCHGLGTTTVTQNPGGKVVPWDMAKKFKPRGQSGDAAALDILIVHNNINVVVHCTAKTAVFWNHFKSDKNGYYSNSENAFSFYVQRPRVTYQVFPFMYPVIRFDRTTRWYLSDWFSDMCDIATGQQFSMKDLLDADSQLACEHIVLRDCPFEVDGDQMLPSKTKNIDFGCNLLTTDEDTVMCIPATMSVVNRVSQYVGDKQVHICPGQTAFLELHGVELGHLFYAAGPNKAAVLHDLTSNDLDLVLDRSHDKVFDKVRILRTTVSKLGLDYDTVTEYAPNARVLVRYGEFTKYPVLEWPPKEERRKQSPFIFIAFTDKFNSIEPEALEALTEQFEHVLIKERCPIDMDEDDLLFSVAMDRASCLNLRTLYVRSVADTKYGSFREGHMSDLVGYIKEYRDRMPPKYQPRDFNARIEDDSPQNLLELYFQLMHTNLFDANHWQAMQVDKTFYEEDETTDDDYAIV